MAISCSSEVCPFIGKYAGFLHRALNRDLLAVVFLDVDRHLRVLQIFGAELRRQVALDLCGVLPATDTSPTSGKLIVPVSETCTLLVSSGT